MTVVKNAYEMLTGRPEGKRHMQEGGLIRQKLYLRLQYNLFIFSFSLSQHVSAVHGHHQVFFGVKLFHSVVHPTPITYKCDVLI
jgi:hypothetical protein